MDDPRGAASGGKKKAAGWKKKRLSAPPPCPISAPCRIPASKSRWVDGVPSSQKAAGCLPPSGWAGPPSGPRGGGAGGCHPPEERPRSGPSPPPWQPEIRKRVQRAERRPSGSEAVSQRGDRSSGTWRWSGGCGRLREPPTPPPPPRKPNRLTADDEKHRSGFSFGFPGFSTTSVCVREIFLCITCAETCQNFSFDHVLEIMLWFFKTKVIMRSAFNFKKTPLFGVSEIPQRLCSPGGQNILPNMCLH